MSDETTTFPKTAVDMPFAHGTYDLTCYSWFEKREELGQKKYGRGRQNAGYRRDNLMDVLEEITDAITIIGFLEARFARTANPMWRQDVRLGQRIVSLRGSLVDAANECVSLREDVADQYEELMREKVKRTVPLAYKDE